MSRTKVINTTATTAQRMITILASVIFAGTFLLYALIQYQKHRQFLTFGWDVAVFDQPIYLFSRGLTPYSSLMQMNTLGDHFHPLLLLLGGWVYEFWPNPLFLFWLQSAVAITSGLVIFLLATKILKHKLLSLSISLMYLFSVGFQSMVLDDYHDDVMVALPLTLAFYFIHRRHWLGFWLSTLWILLTKEEFGLLVAALGLFLMITRISLKHGFASLVVGVSVFYLLLQVIMPIFSRTPTYAHYSGTNSLQAMIGQISRQPWLPLTTLFNHPQKQKTLIVSTLSFGGLPFLAPAYLIPVLESLIIRFIDATAPLRFEFNNHYNGPLITLLAVASIYGAQRALKFIPLYFLTGLILVTTLIQNLVFHGPVNSLFKSQFYQLQDWQNDAHALVKQVPRTGSLATQNFLLPHLSQREQFCLLPATCNAFYLAVVLNYSGPDFYGPPLDKLQEQLDQLVATNQYQIIWQKNQSLLLKRVK